MSKVFDKNVEINLTSKEARINKIMNTTIFVKENDE